MRSGFVPIADFATRRVAQSDIGDFRRARRNASVGLGQAGLGVCHGDAVDGGRVVDEILDGSAGRVCSVVNDTGIPVQQVERRTGGVSGRVGPLNQVAVVGYRSAIGI